jgi:hypothetical protein
VGSAGVGVGAAAGAVGRTGLGATGEGVAAVGGKPGALGAGT